MSDWSRLKRKKESMPAHIRRALIKEDLLSKYKERPPYQQNDYLAWIKRGKRTETKNNRINQMVSELREGNVYMKMRWNKKN